MFIMKNNFFERIMLVLILISVIYGIILLSKKQASSSAPSTTFQYIPQSQKNIRNSTPGTLGESEQMASIDTLLITNSHIKGKNNCPCCQQAYFMMYSSTDSTNNPKDPKLILFRLSATDTTTDPKDPKITNP